MQKQGVSCAYIRTGITNPITYNGKRDKVNNEAGLAYEEQCGTCGMEYCVVRNSKCHSVSVCGVITISRNCGKPESASTVESRQLLISYSKPLAKLNAISVL